LFYRSNEKADKKPIKAERQNIIMGYVKNNGSVSNKEARELLSLADSTTKRVLNEMVNCGLLEVKGEKKTRRYYLKGVL
jgi:predicted HTH transcriptional regulator